MAASAHGQAMKTSSGAAALGFDRAGRVALLTLGSRSALLPRAIGGSGFALRDHARSKEFIPLLCMVTKQGQAVRFRSESQGLSLEATMTAVVNGWEVKGTLTRSGVERFVSLRFGLPISVEGWQFWRDVVRSKKMHEDTDATNAVSNGLGSGSLDYRPITAISSDKGAVAYAVRMDEQWFRHVAYRSATGLFSVTMDYALVDGQKFHEKQVPLHFYLLTPSGAWGLRAVVATYFRLFPQWGEAPGTKPGGWVAWGDMADHESPLCDFGLTYHEGPTVSGYKTGDALGLISLPYIEPSMYQQYHGDLNRAPSTAEAYERLRRNAAAVAEVVPAKWGQEQRQWIHDISAGILKTPVVAENGEPVVPATGNWPWIGDSNYGAQFPLDLLPDIPGSVGEERLGECGKALANPSADGMYLDSYCAHFGVVDFNRDNVNASPVPPTFSGKLKPCVTVWSSLFPWVEKLRTMLSPKQQCILPNIYGIAGPTPWHCFDVIGKEGAAGPTGALMAQCREVGYDKVVTQLIYENHDYDFLKQLLVFDVFPGGIGRKGDAPSGMRESYRKLLPCLRVLHHLKWQPIPLAMASERGIQVERYGQAPGPVLFVATNEREPKVATITIPKSAISGHKGAWCWDPLDETPLDWKWQRDSLEVSVGLASGQTALFSVGDFEAHSALDLLFARDRIDDIRLSFREYGLRNGKPHRLAGQPKGLRAEPTSSAAAKLRTLSKEATEGDPITRRLRELAAAAADLLGDARQPTPRKPRKAVASKASPRSSLALPWAEEFDQRPDPAQWTMNAGGGRVDFSEGKVWMELKQGTSVGLTHTGLLDFGTRPIVIEAKFENLAVAGWWYIGTFVSLRPSAGSEDYLNVRVDNGSKIRLENGETAASNYEKAIFDYKPIKPNVPHLLKLYLDADNYRLEIDGQLFGEGRHDLTFTRGNLSLAMYSGHAGHGDVWWVDYVRVSSAEAKPGRREGEKG